MLTYLNFIHGFWFWAQNFWKTKVVLTIVVTNNMGFWVNISMTPNTVWEKWVDIQSVQFPSRCIPSVRRCLDTIKVHKGVKSCFINLYFRKLSKRNLPCKILHMKANCLWQVDALLVFPRAITRLYFFHFETKVSPILCIVD